MVNHISKMNAEFMTGGFVLIGYINEDPVMISNVNDRKSAIAVNALSAAFFQMGGATPTPTQ